MSKNETKTNGNRKLYMGFILLLLIANLVYFNFIKQDEPDGRVQEQVDFSVRQSLNMQLDKAITRIDNLKKDERMAIFYKQKSDSIPALKAATAQILKKQNLQEKDLSKARLLIRQLNESITAIEVQFNESNKKPSGDLINYGANLSMPLKKSNFETSRGAVAIANLTVFKYVSGLKLNFDIHAVDLKQEGVQPLRLSVVVRNSGGVLDTVASAIKNVHLKKEQTIHQVLVDFPVPFGESQIYKIVFTSGAKLLAVQTFDYQADDSSDIREEAPLVK